MPAKTNGIHKVIKCRREWKKYQLEKIMPRTWFHTNGGCLILLRLHEWSETDNYCNNNNKYAAEANLASAFLVMFKKIKPNSRFNRWACVHSELKSCQDLKKIKWRLKIMLIVNINKKIIMIIIKKEDYSPIRLTSFAFLSWTNTTSISAWSIM